MDCQKSLSGIKLATDKELPFLTADSVVLEAGAYRGDWAYEVATKYHCTVHAFEPATLALKFLRKKVDGLDNVIIHPVALGVRDEKITLHNCQRDGASVYATIGKSEVVQSVDASLAVGKIGHLDLIHLNAEGAELDILNHLIDTGQISDIERIMVQWHPSDRKEGLNIRYIEKQLLVTHTRQRGYRAWGLYVLRKDS